MALLEFPTEILIKIILNLEFQSVLSFHRVNRFLYHLYQSSPLLQYHVECGVAGVHDNPNCTLPVKTRLQMLRDRESAWTSRRPSVRSEKLSFPTSDVDIVDVAGGHYYFGLRANLDAPSWIHSRPIPTHMEDTTPEHSNYRSKLFVEGLLEIGTCIDEHDLIVCLVASVVPMSEDFDFQISLIQHSSGEPHPAAAKTTFSIFRAPGRLTDIALQMEVVGENLVLAFELPSKRLYFYNWQTGENKAALPHRGHSKFTFLRHDLVCHPNLEDMSLDIYYIPSSCEVGSVRCIQVLSLPEDFVQGEVDWVGVKSSPNPTFGGLFPKYVPPNQPFLERPEEAIIMFQFASNEVTSVSMIVHRKSLLKFLPPKEHWSNETHLVPWEEWSPDVALFNPLHNLKFAPTGQHGQRCIADVPLEEIGPSFCLFDFNPYRIRRTRAIDPRIPVPHKAGGLPYAVTVLPEKCVHQLPFISDTCLLGINFYDKELGYIQITELGVMYFV